MNPAPSLYSKTIKMYYLLKMQKQDQNSVRKKPALNEREGAG